MPSRHLRDARLKVEQKYTEQTGAEVRGVVSGVRVVARGNGSAHDGRNRVCLPSGMAQSAVPAACVSLAAGASEALSQLAQ